MRENTKNISVNTRKLIWYFFLFLFFVRPAFFHLIAFHIISFGIFLSFGLKYLEQHQYSNIIFSYCRYPLLCVWFKHVLNVLWFSPFSGHTSLAFSTVKLSRLCIHKYCVLCTALNIRCISQYVFEIISQDSLGIWYKDVPVLLLKLLSLNLFSYSPQLTPCLLSFYLGSSCLVSSVFLLLYLLSSHLVSFSNLVLFPLTLTCLHSSLVLSPHISSLTLLPFLSHLLSSLVFSCPLLPPLPWLCLLSSLVSSLLLLCISQVSWVYTFFICCPTLLRTS